MASGAPVSYLVEVNTSAASFTLSLLNTAWPQVYLRGTSNGWGTTPFVYVDQQAWVVETTCAGKSDDRFKFDVWGNWSESYGDGDKDGIADQLANNDIPITQGADRYRIFVNAATRRYVVTKLPDSSTTTVKRTVVFIYGQAQPGQDMFIRSGIDHDRAAAGEAAPPRTSSARSPSRTATSHATTKLWKAGDIAQTGTPYTSKNHFAQCGKVNMFQRGSSGVVFGEL
jgi:hypothetical protein